MKRLAVGAAVLLLAMVGYVLYQNRDAHESDRQDESKRQQQQRYYDTVLKPQQRQQQQAPPQQAVYRAPLTMRAFMYEGHKTSAKLLADSYIRLAYPRYALVFSATDKLGPEVVKRPDGIYKTDPMQTWTAEVIAELHDGNGRRYLSLTLQIDTVGETESVFRVLKETLK